MSYLRSTANGTTRIFTAKDRKVQQQRHDAGAERDRKSTRRVFSRRHAAESTANAYLTNAGAPAYIGAIVDQVKADLVEQRARLAATLRWKYLKVSSPLASLTGDPEYVRGHIAALERDLQFWTWVQDGATH